MGKYKALGAFFDRVFRNDLNKNFDDVDADIKIQKARVDNLITGNPQPEEVMDLRTDTDGIIHGTAWDRFASDESKKAAKFQELDAQLAEKAEQVQVDSINLELSADKSNRKPLSFGKIVLPDDFNKLNDFEFYRDFDGTIKSTYKFGNLFKVEKTIYLSEQGNDANDGLTKNTSLRTLSKAIDVAQAQAEDNITINLLNVYFSTGGAGSGLSKSLTKNILIQADESIGRSFVGSFWRNDASGTAWIAETGGLYSAATATVPQYILDGNLLDYRGIPKELEYKGTNAQTSLTNGSWTYDTVNKKIIVKPFGEFISSKIIVLVIHTKNIFTVNSKTLAFRNIDFLYNSNSADTNNQGYGGIQVIGGQSGSKVICDNCSSSYAFRNGFYIDDINYTYMINCTASNNGADGFNYDGRKSGKPYELIVEYNCHSYNNGRIHPGNTNNCTTAHGGVHILRVGSVGYKSNGPTCADVQGCYSILYDCHMRGNTTDYPGSATDASFWFDNNQQVTGLGKAILINCSSPKDDAGYGLSTDGTMDLKINNFRGKIKGDIPYIYV